MIAMIAPGGDAASVAGRRRRGPDSRFALWGTVRSTPMRDGDVRSALRSRLAIEHEADSDTLTIDELGLCGRVRVDVAVVNGYLAGFELKSERDTLRRLPTQVEVYSKVLDLATLVVAERHQAHALDVIPTWWGVLVARQGSDGIELEFKRAPSMNDEIDPHSLVRLLWHDEALAELDARDLADGVRSKPRAAAWRRLADELPLDELRAAVRARLKARRGWRSSGR